VKGIGKVEIVGKHSAFK